MGGSEKNNLKSEIFQEDVKVQNYAIEKLFNLEHNFVCVYTTLNNDWLSVLSLYSSNMDTEGYSCHSVTDT